MPLLKYIELALNNMLKKIMNQPLRKRAKIDIESLLEQVSETRSTVLQVQSN